MNDILKIEPLKELLDLYDDKNVVFVKFMNIETLNQLEGSVYYEEKIDQLFIYDKISCVDKSTLNILHYGQIIYYSKEDITIKKKSKYCIRIDPEDFYIFYTRCKKKLSKKDMVSLLKIL